MDREFEIAGAASAGGWLRWRKQHAVPIGTPCANCGTEIQGPYCHNCGQLAEGFHRTIGHLAIEAVETFFHFDGRFWRTVPNLIVRPGQLTRDYLDGKRAYQIPPMRLFLIVLLLVFFTGTLNLGSRPDNKIVSVNQTSKASASGVDVRRNVVVTPGAAIQFSDDKDAQPGSKPDGKPSSEESSKIGRWLNERAKAAAANPELFEMTLETWAHRFAFLMLPIAALILSLLFIFQRQFYIFDHLIFSLHSLSFQGLLLSIVFLGSGFVPGVGLLLFLAPIHLFLHMRRTYATAIWSTILRMGLLSIGTTFALAGLAIGLLWVGLSSLKVH